MSIRKPVYITSRELYQALNGDGELALLDVREELSYSQSHLLYASCMPLSRLEAFAPRLVVRFAVPVVLVDANEGLAARAADRMHALGYTNVRILQGGIAAWAEAGYELFSGVNVPSKAFGEYVEHACDTPSVSAQELHNMLTSGQDMVVLDSRPMSEFQRENIPTGVCVPGAELAYRVHDLAPNPATKVVVNCAGRTRSIIGAQSLRNAGIANEVVALRNGTMGWHLAGFEVERNASRTYEEPSPEGLRRAQAAAEAVAERHGVEIIDEDILQQWQVERDERSLFVFDVRSPEEYVVAHRPGIPSAPGGQLVQETDTFVGTLRARIVLLDDTGVRALMTASWLRQMGWGEVAVLRWRAFDATLIGGPEPVVWLGIEKVRCDTIVADVLCQAVARREMTVVDLSTSRHYKLGHVPGAHFAIRARLADTIGNLSGSNPLVFVCEDGRQSRFAAEEAAALTQRAVMALEGGMRAWREAGLATESGGETWADHPDDVWLKPFERGLNLEQAMEEYLTWEVALVEQIERDGTTRFDVGRKD